MEYSDDIICQKFLKNTQKNPRTNRTITEGKDVYNSLVKLCIERNFDVSHLKIHHNTSSKKSNIQPKKESITQPKKELITQPKKNLITKPKKELIIQTKTNIELIIQTKTNLELILENLLPKDILSLYLSDIEIEKKLDTKEAIDILNSKFHINVNTNLFMTWYKSYIIRNIDPNIIYLYDLENYRYIDENSINNILNRENNLSENNLSENKIYILFDWLYAVGEYFKMPSTVIAYTYTLFFILISKTKNILTQTNLQLYGSVCLNYSSLILEEHSPASIDYVYMANNSFSIEEFDNACIEIFNIFNGILIYPSPIFFIDTTINKTDENDNIILLTILSSMIMPISIYKPSLIAKTCIYMITGKTQIYSFTEINIICNTIEQYLNKFSNFKLEQITPRAKTIKINYICDINYNFLTINDLYYTEPWHLGDIENREYLGKGTYGQVIKIKRKICGKEYALKTTTNINFIPNALVEISILSLLKNETNIINICGYKYNDDNNVSLILPLMDSSLLYLLKNDLLNIDKYDRYFKQILEGVYQCHKYDIVHRDLKLENLVYDKDTDIIKLIDFGTSVSYQSFRKITLTSMANTYNYRPPECLLNDGYQYGQEIDIWAIGCVMYYMMTKTYIINDDFMVNNKGLNDIFTLLGTPTPLTWPEFDLIPKSETIIIQKHEPQLDKLKKVLFPYSSIILDCLTVNPNKRPNAANILSSNYI